ncbi:hypothetical protein [Croceimicrobium hydrocarbonivorans]|uniref:Uncharacterized protein n=1 Tax=Croceimicrobium hydrocarbonivorans TaxID=2761580 RepID=A0A7H0VCN2_9FLAO|nr:hypothetical protein [Croceimicrobium hydrocarbonivorans]QNR23480.1 hypothetical protein H4K34_13995 [Croceimicrobium hydrocarbonivorans]
MLNRFSKFFALSLICGLTWQCQTDSKTALAHLKSHPSDPFKESMVESQYFDIDTKTNQVIEGKEGTVVLIPKGSFINAKGEPVLENVQLELAEALTLDQMILSNLTTTSGTDLLETDGMIYLKASANGEDLKIDPNNPIYIEIPTAERKAGMMAYKGLRDENGNMDWIEPKKLETFLQTVDLDLLNFYPKDFEATAAAGLPFRKHEELSKELVDSLYYSLNYNNPITLDRDTIVLNEAFNNPNSQIVNGEYTAESFSWHEEVALDTSSIRQSDSIVNCGVDPATIKTIRRPKFENSLIATREFEKRLQSIFFAKEGQILIDIYIENMDKNLWELDSMAANILGNDTLAKTFRQYQSEKLGKVENANQYASLLKNFYQDKLEEVKAELKALRDKYQAELKAKKAVAKTIADKYRKVLWKREKYRMERYGLLWSSQGWINIDRGPARKNWFPKKLELIVDNSESFDRIYSYVVYTSIKSIYRMNSIDSKTFFVGNKEDREMYMPQKSSARIISIAYIGEESYLGITEFETEVDNLLNLNLIVASKSEIEETLLEFDDYKQENSIEEDLKYMDFFYKENKRLAKLRSENKLMSALWAKAFPNCL